MRRLLLLLLLLAVSITIQAQNAVVEESLTEVTCNNYTHATTYQRETVTILSEQGAHHALFSCSCSKNDKLTNFRGQVTDSSGRIIRKLKESELQRTEYSEYLAVDDYHVFLDYTPPTYPVTITYEWTIESRDNLVEFAWFCPQDDYDVSVHQATYRLTTPADMVVRHALQNIKAVPDVSEGPKGTQVLTLQLTDLPAIRREPYARPLQERMPMAYFAPREFTYFGTKGNLTDWKEYGRWEYSLLTGRDLLTEETKAELHRLTDGLKTEHEKVEAIYQYLGRTTRYVAVLLGIGGQQPASASQVSKSGFGDCKGLSNYMRALLKEIGIDSNYTTISTHHRQLLPDFASVGQMNHVILQVPLASDTLWLECTNPELPFGYVHEDIAGHDAVNINSDGGQLVRLPVYPDTANTQRSKIMLTLTADGSADIALSQTWRNRQYERHVPLLKMDEQERLRTLHRMVRATQCTFYDVDIQQNNGASLTLDTRIHSQRYASQTGQRLFVPLCPLRQGINVPQVTATRTEPLCIDMGYFDQDSITIQLPDGYVVEAQPKDISIEKPFGTFSFHMTRQDQTLYVSYRLLVHAGTYPAPLYADFAAFIKSVDTAYGQKIVLRLNDKS